MPIEIVPEPAPPTDAAFDADAYVASVGRTLTVIRASRVGQAVMRHLWKRVEIRPWVRRGRTASARALRRRDALPAGAPDRYDSDSGHTRHDDTGHAVDWVPRGTGRGSDVRIEFTPALYLAPNAPIPVSASYPRYGDCVLLHELVHAARMMWGVVQTLRFEPARDERVWGFRNSEEYYAVLIENMYRSERHIPMRQDYVSDRRLRFVCSAVREQDPYIQLERRWIAKLQVEMPTLVSELERIPRFIAARNPFADARYGSYDSIPARGARPRRLTRVPTHAAYYLIPRPVP